MRDTLIALLPTALRVSIFLSVLALGLKATLSDATYLFRKPESLARSLLSMYGVMLLVALVLGLSFDFRRPVELALVTLALSPLPPFLPSKALKAKGRQVFTVGLLVATALISIVSVPLLVALFGRIFDVPLRMPASSVTLLMLTSVLLPLAIGLGLRKRFPSMAERAAHPLEVFGTVMLFASFLPLLFGVRQAIFSLVGDGTLLAFFVFSTVGLISGHALGGPTRENRTVLALATSSRHPAMAIAIARTNFPDEKLIPVAVLMFLIVSAIISAAYLAWSERQTPNVGTPMRVSRSAR